MIFNESCRKEVRATFARIDSYLEKYEQKWVKYADLGCKTVKIISYSEEFLPLVQKQLTYVLKDNATKYDATLIIWNEKNISALTSIHKMFDPKVNMRIRIEKLYNKDYKINNSLVDEYSSKEKPAIRIMEKRGFFIASDYETNTYYYGVRDLSPEEFIKEGHIFVQFFNDILKTPNSNLAHGAVIGLNGDGILFCARGQRGKSTLSVLSMMKGFEYVSDDYLILHENEKGELLSSPIYSIITLSPEMYNRLYDYMSGSQFVSNNARKDKYVFNISNFHPQFRKNYPIKIAIFPEIVTDKEPSIRFCTPEEKGRAITHLIQSTLSQTADLNDIKTIKKMYNMVKNLPFYKFNLCHDIDKNTEFLRDFINNLDRQNKTIIDTNRMFYDITFDLANILDSETGAIYSMNKFTTNIFENLLKGISSDAICSKLTEFIGQNPNILNEFSLLMQKLNNYGILKQTNICEKQDININLEFALENSFKISLKKGYEEQIKENLKNELCIK